MSEAVAQRLGARDETRAAQVAAHPRSDEHHAHQSIEAEQDATSSIGQQAAEYETLAAAAQRDHWIELLRDSELTPAQVEDVVGSAAFGPLTSELRRAEANGHDVEQLLASVVSQHALNDAEDVAAVLRYRLAHAHPAGGHHSERTHLVVGLIPVALGPMDAEHRTALDQRQSLIETHAQSLVEEAADAKPVWVRRLGELPPTMRARGRWLTAVTAFAAYRDRYALTSAMPLGGNPVTDTQRLDRLRAAEALRHAQQIADDANPNTFSRPRHRLADDPLIHSASGRLLPTASATTPGADVPSRRRTEASPRLALAAALSRSMSRAFGVLGTSSTCLWVALAGCG